MNDHDIWKFNLQLFADDPAPDTGSDEGAEAPEGKPPEDKLEKPEQGKKRYTDEDVDDIINRKFAEWQKKQQKAVNEAKKLAEMNAQQKAEYERDQLQKELDDYKRKDSLAEMTKTAPENAVRERHHRLRRHPVRPGHDRRRADQSGH